MTTQATPIIVEAKPLTKWEEHNQFQREVIAQLAGELANGSPVDPLRIEITIDPRYDNTILREFAIKEKIVTKAQFVEMYRKVKIKNELGSIPSCATDLVSIVVKRDKVECQFDGMLSRTVVPFMVNEKTGEKEIISVEDMKITSVATWVQFHFPKKFDFITFERELRILSANLNLGYSLYDISDALTQWYETAKKTRLHDLFNRVGYGKPSSMVLRQVDPMWEGTAAHIFDTSHDSPEFVIAVLKKFIWQVKRKIAGLEVTNHLMPVLLGPQGVGKTTFVKKLIEPLAELSLEVDFKMIEDDRNIDIWNSYILFLDEMGYASKVNVDSIKHAITATSLARRPMRTNSKVMVNQNATFIGCSNKALAQLIKDPTGIRRFVGLQFSTKPDRDVMNAIDYGLLWESVDLNAEDPLLPFMDLLNVKQEEDREKGRVEDWLSQFDPSAPSPRGDYGTTFAQVSKKNRIQGASLFLLYSEWEGVMHPGSYGRLSVNEFQNEMKRLMDNTPERVPFEKGTRSNKGVTYVYTGSENVIPLQRVGYVR